MGAYELVEGDDAIMGLDELLGMEELLGASRPSYARLAAVKAAGGTVLRKKPPQVAHDLPLGFDSVTAVTKSTSGTITSRPQKIFRPDRLVVANAIAAFFLINSLNVGVDNMFVSTDAIPAEAFSNLSVGVGLKLATAKPGIDIALGVSNIDTLADHRFNGVLIGPAVS